MSEVKGVRAWGIAGVLTMHLACMGAVTALAQDDATKTLRADEPLVLKLSLADAIQAALDNNPNVKYYRERIEAARSVSRTQLGALLPNLSSQGKFNNQTFFFGTIGGAPVRSDPFNIVDGRGTLSQSLFSLSLIDRWRASRSAFQVAELESAATQNDTMATVALHYFDILRNQEMVAARVANVALFEDLVTFVRRRQSGGMATGLDVARLESQLENERQRLELAKGDVERTKVILQNDLGIGFEGNRVSACRRTHRALIDDCDCRVVPLFEPIKVSTLTPGSCPSISRQRSPPA